MYHISGEKKSQCSHCFAWVHKRSMSRHVQNKHGENISVQCSVCEKVFKNLNSMKEHMRCQHRFYQTSAL